MGQQSSANPVPKNPYISMNPIRDRESLHMFHGREAQLRQFYRDIAIRQSVSITGPRQIGKTSFLWCACQPEVQERFDEDLHRHLIVLLDLRESLYQTADGFFQHVSEAIVRQARARGLMLQPIGESADLYLSVLTQVYDQGFRLVLLLDSFDTLARNEHFGPEFLSFLRSQSSNGNVTYVTASIQPLYELGHKGIKDSPFFNLFDEIKLSSLNREEAEQLIREPAQREGLPFTDEEVEWILKYAGLHLCFIRRACAVLFDLKLQSPRQQVSRQRFLNKAYSVFKPLFQDTWDRLSEQDQAVIRDEVRTKETLEQQAQIESGQEDEVDQAGRQFPELTGSAFFRQFVRDINNIGLFKMTREELEEALEHMHDLAALGETDLRLMKAVRQRLNGNTSPTPIDRGKAIQTVLREALERLRGRGQHADSEPSWYTYNILDYRYFTRYRLKHREIRVRLEFNNDRQYYRKHSAALATLLNVIFEME